MTDQTITLYRPTGEAEHKLVEESGFTKWPPRLPDQPIFYPVTNARYAEEIASRWNTQNGQVGFVMCFEVKKSFMDNYFIETVGAQHHTEWWIPAEMLTSLNQNIVGKIEVIGRYTVDPPAPEEHRG